MIQNRIQKVSNQKVNINKKAKIKTKKIYISQKERKLIFKKKRINEQLREKS